MESEEGETCCLNTVFLLIVVVRVDQSDIMSDLGGPFLGVGEEVLYDC
jgi:hypothetical protein